MAWEVKKLGDVCEIGDGNHSSKYPKKEEMVLSGIPFIRCKNIINGKISDQDIKYITKEKHSILKKGHLKKGDILFSNRGEIGKIGIVDSKFDNANLNSQLAWFRCPSKLNNKFLFYILQTPNLKSHYQINKSGSALQQFPISKIKNLDILVPPLPIQKQIVSILDEAFEKISKAKENSEQNLKNAKEVFESYLQSVFENKGEGWEECYLEKHIKLIDYRGRTPTKTESGVRLITAKNVKLGFLQLEPQEFIHEDNYESWMTRGIPDFGDVIFTTEAPLANVAQINTNEKLAFAQRIIVMQPEKNKINQTFLKYMLISKPIRKKILEKGTGATVQGIKSRLLKKIVIYFPKEISEQEKIVAKTNNLLKNTEKLESIYIQKLSTLEELKQSILQKAFEGKLTEVSA
jgi:type I restriction enzyme, S subunit